LHRIDSLLKTKREYSAIKTDLEKLPYPAYHLYHRLESIGIVTSLGCPLACTYCASHCIQETFIERSASAVYEEILHAVHAIDISAIAFYDDALLINSEKRFIPLAEKISSKPLPISFHTPNGLHVRFITPAVAESLYKIGVKTLRLSFESTNSIIQLKSSNKISDTELIHARNALMSVGYKSSEIDVYLLVGLPQQEKNDVLESIDFVHGLGLTIKLARYSPIPHTEDFKKTIQRYPFVETDPLFHNNTVFMHKAEGIKEWVEEVSVAVKHKNEQLML
jgi:radical SAM superfamily enzyme YgiQ (UPF0313 family)